MQRGTVRSIIIYICSSVIFSKLFELCVISDLVSFGLDLPSPNGRYDLQGLRQCNSKHSISQTVQAGDGQCCFSQSNFTTVAGLLRNNYTLEVDVNNPGLGTCFILFQDVSICFSPGVLCMVMWRSFFLSPAMPFRGIHPTPPLGVSLPEFEMTRKMKGSQTPTVPLPQCRLKVA